MKKQTRKRVPASRPYQDRLHNMAEARREIVTALRIHRANMRHQQSSKFQQQQPAAQVMSSESVPPVAMSYASSSNNHHLCSCPIANLTAGGAPPAGNYSPSSMLPYDPTPIAINEEEAHASVAIGGQLEHQLACSLPVQPLGLNLTSFQGFGGALLDHAMISDDPFGVPLIQPSSCPAASSFSAYSSSPVAATAVAALGGYSSADASSPAALLSQVLDGEMFYSIGGGDGERQGMELSETAGNVADSSAWWTKIFEGMESGGGGGESAGAEAGTADAWPEWQWLCDGVDHEVAAAAPNVLGMHVDCHGGDHVDNGGGDIALPCMDIGGWDDGTEWFP